MNVRRRTSRRRTLALVAVLAVALASGARAFSARAYGAACEAQLEALAGALEMLELDQPGALDALRHRQGTSKVLDLDEASVALLKNGGYLQSPDAQTTCPARRRDPAPVPRYWVLPGLLPFCPQHGLGVRRRAHQAARRAPGSWMATPTHDDPGLPTRPPRQQLEALGLTDAARLEAASPEVPTQVRRRARAARAQRVEGLWVAWSLAGLLWAGRNIRRLGLPFVAGGALAYLLAAAVLYPTWIPSGWRSVERFHPLLLLAAMATLTLAARALATRGAGVEAPPST